MPGLLLDPLDINPILTDAPFSLDEPFVHAGEFFAEGVILRLEALHRHSTVAERLPLPDLPGKGGDGRLILCKCGEVRLDLRTALIVLLYLLPCGCGGESQVVGPDLLPTHRGDLRLQGFVAAGSEGEGFEVVLQSHAFRDLRFPLPALGAEPPDLSDQHLFFLCEAQVAVTHQEQAVALLPGTLKHLPGTPLRGRDPPRLFLCTGKLGPERLDAVASTDYVQLLEPPGDLPVAPFPGIDDLLQRFHAVFLEVIDAQHLHEPVLPGPGPALDQGEEFLLPGVDGVAEVARTHADDPLHLLPHLLDAACEEFLVQVEVCLMEGGGRAALEFTDDGILVAAGQEVQADLADVLRARKGTDDVVPVDSRPLEPIESKEDSAHNAALAGPVVPDDPGDAVLEDDLLVPEPLEVAHHKFIQQHSLPLCGVR